MNATSHPGSTTVNTANVMTLRVIKAQTLSCVREMENANVVNAFAIQDTRKPRHAIAPNQPTIAGKIAKTHSARLKVNVSVIDVNAIR